MKNKQNVALDLNKLIGEANVIACGARQDRNWGGYDVLSNKASSSKHCIA